MTSTETDQAAWTAIALPTWCWWIDRNDCWEITHHPTRDEAEADHVTSVRGDTDEDLTVADAFALVPGAATSSRSRRSRSSTPGQTRLFEVLPTHDLPGESLGRVILFAEEAPTRGT